MATLAVGGSCIEMLPVPNGVVRVLTPCSPRQIFQSVIRGIVVGVTALHPFRSRANKGFQDEDVDRTVILSLQNDVQMSGRRLTTRTKNSSPPVMHDAVTVVDRSVEGSNFSSVADFITSFMAQDRLPFHRCDATPIGVC